MKKKLYLIFSLFSSVKTKEESVTKFIEQSSKLSDEEIVFNAFMKIEKSQKNNENSFDSIISSFIKKEKYSIEKLTKFGLAFVSSIFQIKLEQIPDQIMLKYDILLYFLAISFSQDFISELSTLSASSLKENIKKNKKLSKSPEQYRQILSKLFQGDISQLRFIVSNDQYKRYSNNKTFLKFLSDLKPYSNIFIEFLVYFSKTDQEKDFFNDEEIDSINRLLNKKFKNKFYEKFLKLNESLEFLKNEILKENFENPENFFSLLQIELTKNIEKKCEKIKKADSKNVHTLSSKDKKELANAFVDVFYIFIEEVQPCNIKKIVKKINS